MHRRGYPLNHKTIRKLMLMIGIKCLIRKKKYRSYKGEVGLVADNVLKRNFTASSPLCKLATDVTQIEMFIAMGLQLLIKAPLSLMFDRGTLQFKFT